MGCAQRLNKTIMPDQARKTGTTRAYCEKGHLEIFKLNFGLTW